MLRRPRRNYIRCHYCPQVTEPTEPDVKEHLKRNHLACFFRCRECRSSKFMSASLASVFVHLREGHSFGDDYTDEELLKHHTEAPGDLRKIYCRLCVNVSPGQEQYSTSLPIWLCQSLKDVDEELEDHLSLAHPDTKRQEDAFILGCRACPEKFAVWHEEQRWRDHLRGAHATHQNTSKGR